MGDVASTKESTDSTRMDNIEQDHDEEHQDGVKNIQKHLVAQEVAIISLLVLHNPKEGSDQDEDACCIQGVEMASPWHLAGCRACRRVPVDPCVVDGGDDDKEAEEDNLDNQSTNHDMLP